MKRGRMRPIKSLLITKDLNLASLWEEDPRFGNSAVVFSPHTPEAQALFETRFPGLRLVSTPAEAMEFQPDVVVALEQGYSALTSIFSQNGIPVVNAGPFMDKLALDPEPSRNALTLLFNPMNSRRFISLHSNPLMIQSEAMYYSLRYPDDQYVMDIGDTQDSLILVSAKEVLNGTDAFLSILQSCPSLYGNRTEGLVCHREEWPSCLFSLTVLYGGSRIGRPIVSWSNGPDKVACWIDDIRLVSCLDKLAASNRIKGALTLRCCLDSSGSVQVYKLDSGMDPWLFCWLRLKLSDKQGWASLWKSMGAGAEFRPQEGDPAPAWFLQVPRESGLAADQTQMLKCAHGFDSDFLLGRSLWLPGHFDLSEFSALEKVASAGLLEKRPLWAATEITKVEQYLKNWQTPTQEILPEPLPPATEPEVPVEPGEVVEIKEEEPINA